MTTTTHTARRHPPALAGLAALVLLVSATACGADAEPGGGSAGAAPAAAVAADRTQADPYSCDPADPGLGVLQAWVPRSDVDGDGRVGDEEFLADAAASLRTWDVDLDGRLTGAEVDRLRTETGDLLATDAARPDYLCLESTPPAREQPPAGAADGSGGGPDILRIVDADADGEVSAVEWDTAAQDRFAAIDCDGADGISTAEAFRFGRQEGCPAG